MSGRPGGITEERVADESVQKVADQVYAINYKFIATCARLIIFCEWMTYGNPLPIYLYIQIRASVEDKEDRKFDEFTAVKYCTQVVAGINYFIKVY